MDALSTENSAASVGDLVMILQPHPAAGEICMVIRYEQSWAYPNIVLHSDGSTRYYTKNGVKVINEDRRFGKN